VGIEGHGFVTRANERRPIVTECIDLVRAVLAGFAGMAPEIRPLSDD
jgi:hypothetical protein